MLRTGRRLYEIFRSVQNNNNDNNCYRFAVESSFFVIADFKKQAKATILDIVTEFITLNSYNTRLVGHS